MDGDWSLALKDLCIKVILTTAALILLRYLWTIIHNLFLHPLAGIPGPLICRVSRVPYWIASLRGDQIYFMKRLHDQYGTVVRLSPDELSYTDAQAWKDIYGYQKGRMENLRTPSFQSVQRYLNP